MLNFISQLIERRFYGKIVLSLQNGKVDTIKQEESLKTQDIELLLACKID